MNGFIGITVIQGTKDNLYYLVVTVDDKFLLISDEGYANQDMLLTNVENLQKLETLQLSLAECIRDCRKQRDNMLEDT